MHYGRPIPRRPLPGKPVSGRPMPGGPMPGRPTPVPTRPFPLQNQAYSPSAKPNVLDSFKTPDGNLDFEKISTTAQQVMNIYNQVSPMITKFIKK
ncbi:YppG family protein [Bacillus piscicola]|uniref:YppG family protein n=1 Tax=Bacillus piscicola TaxID=1632684 RepID=UPI001F095C64|nr:YppG family protein [Bacillus piscicola]